MLALQRVLEFCLFSVSLILLLASETHPADEISWTFSSASVTGIEGQSVDMTWKANVSMWSNKDIWPIGGVSLQPSDKTIITYERLTRMTARWGPFENRQGMNLTASRSEDVITLVFTLPNLNKTTDEREYEIFLRDLGLQKQSPPNNIQLIVIVPPKITDHSSNMTINERDSARLVCDATGDPTPNITWTRNGAVVGSRSPFIVTPSIALGNCYKCIAYNGASSSSPNICININHISTTSDPSTGNKPSAVKPTTEKLLTTPLILLGIGIVLLILILIILIVALVLKVKGVV